MFLPQFSKGNTRQMREGLRSGRTKTHIAKSRIRNAGNGLFANFPIKRLGLADEFFSMVPHKNRNEANKLRQQKLATHCIKFSYDEICDGIKDPKDAPANGKASFANDDRKQFKANCCYVWLTYFPTRVFLKALRDIEIGEELYVSYGKTYWKIHSIKN